jgi:hypothetical protein
VIEKNYSPYDGILRIQNIIACKPTLLEAQEEHKIICIVNDDCKYANILAYDDDTELEAFIMFHNGMNLLTKDQYRNQVKHLGYKIRETDCFNYFNGSNERHYKARCMSNYINTANGLSFANIDNPKDNNFKLLQELRRTCFCYEGGRIWDL